MSPELKALAPAGIDASFGSLAIAWSSVTEWVMTEVLRHSTVCPERILTFAGLKLMKPMSTTAVAFAMAGPWAGPPNPQPARARKAMIEKGRQAWGNLDMESPAFEK